MWNGNRQTTPSWSGNGSQNNYVFPSISSINISASNISATNISTYNLTAYNGYISYNSNITTTTNAVILNPGTILTGNNGALYVNGELISAPSNISSISEWSKFPALTNVDMNLSSITNTLNITATNQITADTVLGQTSVVAPSIQGVGVSGTNGYFPNISTNVFVNNGSMNNVGNFNNNGNVEIAGNLVVALDIRSDTSIRTPTIATDYANVFKQIRVAPIFPVLPNIGSYMTSSTIVGDTIIARNAISTILISSGTGYFSTIFAETIDIGSNLIVPNIDCDNITAIGVGTIATLNVEGELNVEQSAYLNGGAEINGATINNELNMNGNINFPYNTTSDPLVLPPQTQPLYDMSYIRNITCGGLYVQGGWNGNTVLPPYHNNTSVTFGNDGGITSPAVVVINGQNPGFGENLTNALTVRGDMAVDFGTLTTYNGLVCLPFNEEANALEVDGITALNGAVNVIGSTTIEGTTGILGNTTITGAVEVTGGCLFTGGLAQQAGDWTLGNFGTGYTGIINTATTINGSLNMADFNVNNVGTLTATNVNTTNLTATNFITSNILTSNARIPHLSTNTIVVYQDLSGVDIVGGIGFTDISGNQNAFIGLAPSDPYPLVFASLNSIATFAVGSIITEAGGVMELTAQGNATLTGVSNVTMQTVGNATVVSAGGTATLRALNAVSILSDDAGIALEAETGIFMNDNYGASFEVGLGDITATASNITLTASNIYLTNITASNGVIANFSTNILNMYPTPAQQGIIAFYNSNAVFQTLMGLISDTEFQFYNAGALTVSSGGNVGITAQCNANLQATAGLATVTGLNVSISAPVGSISNISLNDTTITAGRNIILTATSNILFGNGNLSNINTITASNIRAPAFSTINISTGTIFTSSIRANNISTIFVQASNITATNNLTASALSTTTISTATIFTNFVNAPVNVNFGKSVIPSGNLDLGASGAFRWRNLWVSTISSIHTQTSTITAQNTVQASTIIADRVTGFSNLNINASSNINVGASNNIFCQSKDEYYISTTKITLTRDVYMSNIYGIGGTNIKVNDNIDMSSKVLYAGAVQATDVYTTNLRGIDSIFVPTSNINVVANLNMYNNNISNVNKMYYSATRQPFIQFGSNNTGATGTTVSLPVSYADANYAVQLTYIGVPGGSQTLYLISQTTSNFTFHGHNNSPTYWTTLGFNN